VARFTALIDANVLFSMVITDLIMEVARAGIFRPRWSDAIHEEWMRSVLEKYPDQDREKINRRRAAMDLAMPDALVTGYEHLIEGLPLVDKDDRHVLAAAIAGGADVIVTKNLKHFPDDVLGQFGTEAQHPDTFLTHQRGLHEQQFLACARKCRARLKNQPKSADEYLEGLQRAELVAVANELAKVKGLL
jgi:hypothetical protein